MEGKVLQREGAAPLKAQRTGSARRPEGAAARAFLPWWRDRFSSLLLGELARSCGLCKCLVQNQVRQAYGGESHTLGPRWLSIQSLAGPGAEERVWVDWGRGAAETQERKATGQHEVPAYGPCDRGWSSGLC